MHVSGSKTVPDSFPLSFFLLVFGRLEVDFPVQGAGLGVEVDALHSSDESLLHLVVFWGGMVAERLDECPEFQCLCRAVLAELIQCGTFLPFEDFFSVAESPPGEGSLVHFNLNMAQRCARSGERGEKRVLTSM